MKVKDLREILLHYEDDWNIALWDYENQREIKWNGGMYCSSKDNKTITFPVECEPVDGIHIYEKLKEIMGEKEDKEDGK